MKVAKIPPEERETILVIPGLGDQLAAITTCEGKLKRQVIAAGGRVMHEGKTSPVYWNLMVDKDLVRIVVRKKMKRVMSPEQREQAAARLKAAREAK